ncbi:hypothetical protein BY458DRAFT_182536 [Sporodiniella umbellata]|nr:hypothetical protein BY458DRAFT_182536 [Sporodiniella umbellata]
MGQSTSTESIGGAAESTDCLHDDCSPIDSFFPIMNTAEAPSNCPEAMSSSIIETTHPLKEGVLKPSKNANSTLGLASKIIPKRPWSNYQLFPLHSLSRPISDSKARMIRSPRVQPKENKGGETNRNQTKEKVKLVESSQHEAISSEDSIEELSKQNSDIDQLIAMMQNHKVSDENGTLDFSRNAFVPSSEFQFSFPTTPSQFASPVTLNVDEDEEEYQDQFKYDMVKNRKILPLPKRKLKHSPDTATRDSNRSAPNIYGIPSSPFTFSSEKAMPKASFLTDASRSMLQQQKQQQTQESNTMLSETNSIADTIANSQKDRPSMSKKIKSIEVDQNSLTHDEKTTIGGKRKESASGHTTEFKAPPKLEKFTTKDRLDFSRFDFKFSADNKTRPFRQTVKTRRSMLTTTLATPATAIPTSAPDTITDHDTNLSRAANYSKTKDTKKPLSVKPPPMMAKRLSISQSTLTNGAKGKGKENEKKKSNQNTSKTTKKNTKKNKNRKEEIAPGGFLSSDITLFDNPVSDDWICFFCQFDIFCNGMEDAKKKNGYYRRKNEKLSRTNEARRITSGVDSIDDPFDDEHRLHHIHA